MRGGAALPAGGARRVSGLAKAGGEALHRADPFPSSPRPLRSLQRGLWPPQVTCARYSGNTGACVRERKHATLAAHCVSSAGKFTRGFRGSSIASPCPRKRRARDAWSGVWECYFSFTSFRSPTSVLNTDLRFALSTPSGSSTRYA